MEFDYRISQHYLLVNAAGDFDLDQTLATIPVILRCCRDNALNKVLVDMREMAGYWPATERIIMIDSYISGYREHLQQGGEEIQLVQLASPAMLGAYRPGSEFAELNGVSMVVTSDLDEAIK